jgi:hypothetical protein
MMTVMTLWLALEAPAPASNLTPEARAHNERGVALVDAGQLDAGIAELERAYAAMPDPLKHRAGRGIVLGSLRGALRRRYESTGAQVDLCRMRELLWRHRTELLTALGAAGSPRDVAGTDGAVRELDAELGGRPCEAPLSTQPPVTPTARPPEPARVASTRPPPRLEMSPRARRLRGAGWAVLGVGGLAAVGSVTAAAIYGDRYRRLDDLDRELTTSEAVAEKRGLHHEGRVARTSAVVLGVGSGVLLVAGILLLDGAARQPKRVSVTPTVTASLLGIELAGRF